MNVQELITAFPILWDTAIQQVYIDIATNYVVVAILIAVLLRTRMLAKLRARDERYTPEDFIMVSLFLFLDATIAIVLAISATRMVLNPAFFAMEYVIKWVGG